MMIPTMRSPLSVAFRGERMAAVATALTRRLRRSELSGQPRCTDLSAHAAGLSLCEVSSHLQCGVRALFSDALRVLISAWRTEIQGRLGSR